MDARYSVHHFSPLVLLASSRSTFYSNGFPMDSPMFSSVVVAILFPIDSACSYLEEKCIHYMHLKFVMCSGDISKPTVHRIKGHKVYGYLPRIDELREDADEQQLFSPRCNPNHVLHRFLPQPNYTYYNLSQRTHNLTFPMDVTQCCY